MLRGVLIVLVLWSLLMGFRVRNPDPPIPDLSGIEVDGELAFFSRDRESRSARYRFDAVRYALAPRRITWERRPRSPWLLADPEDAPPDYEPVGEHGGLVLLRRR